MSLKLIEFDEKSGDFTKAFSLLRILDLEGAAAPVISVVGAGGKTSVVTRLAQEYLKRGREAVVTTTTKMYENADWPILETLSLPLFEKELKKYKVVWLGEKIAGHKIRGAAPEFLKAACLGKIPVIIEADGAKGMPCKAPAAHEPVIMDESTVVLGVLGIDGIGKEIRKICHRPEMAADVLQSSLSHKLNCEDYAKLALSSCGLRKQVTINMDFHLILNKIDGPKEFVLAKKICNILKEKGFGRIHLTSHLGEVDENFN